MRRRRPVPTSAALVIDGTAVTIDAVATPALGEPGAPAEPSDEAESSAPDTSSSDGESPGPL